MTSGRIAKPTALKLIEGNRGKRKINKREPVATGLPAIPENMTTIGQVIWKRVVGSMPEAVYTTADSFLLGAYCEAVSMWMEATDYFAKGGDRIVKGSSGQDVVSPWVKIQADSARQILQIGARLGLDPAARQALNTPKESAPDEFDGLIAH